MTEAEFNKLSRPELNELATEQGLDPEQYGNKDEVKAGIVESGYEFDEETNDNEAGSASDSSEAEALEQPGHPVKFDETGNPVYGRK